MIEEAYEVIGAIDEDDPYHLYDELGDMLLQVMLHAEIARKHGEFDIGDVITAIGEKMVSRHSHIFGNDKVEDAEGVSDLWNKNKMAERGQTTYTESMRDVARSLPATLRASKLLKRLDNACKVEESIEESVAVAVKRVTDIAQSKDHEWAVGEALLSIIAVARATGADPEIALNAASDRMIDRFAQLEADTIDRGENFEHIDEKVLRKYWEKVKLLANVGK
jgi:tetrapyrrole methylase family protein/MazG family protein